MSTPRAPRRTRTVREKLGADVAGARERGAVLLVRISGVALLAGLALPGTTYSFGGGGRSAGHRLRWDWLDSPVSVVFFLLMLVLGLLALREGLRRGPVRWKALAALAAAVLVLLALLAMAWDPAEGAALLVLLAAPPCVVAGGGLCEGERRKAAGRWLAGLAGLALAGVGVLGITASREVPAIALHAALLALGALGAAHLLPGPSASLSRSLRAWLRIGPVAIPLVYLAYLLLGPRRLVSAIFVVRAVLIFYPLMALLGVGLLRALGPSAGPDGVAQAGSP